MEAILQEYHAKMHELKQFLVGAEVFFKEHPKLNQKPFPIVHSIKTRYKDPDHLAEKIQRKLNEGRVITKDNLFSEVTDLIGVRVLHLYQDQFPIIHNEIKAKIDSGDWVFVEPPKAYSWDPESAAFFKDLGIETQVRETYYTSIHYVVKPNNPNKICCEIQVRTLFEEIWGEIDHTINYPNPSGSKTCKEQLRVLSKLVSNGTRLADSIFRAHDEHTMQNVIHEMQQIAESEEVKPSIDSGSAEAH